MKGRVLVAVVIAVILLAGISWATNAQKEKEAVSAARNWLNLVDAGEYSKRWQEAAGYFKNAVQQDQWEQMIKSVRMPLGKMISRKLKTSVYKTTLPGAPDGQYVVIQFETSFQNKESAIETVTPMFDKDGRWTVSGYYIK
ncbi:MAG: DUF4019 domain-containing protein [Smithella sp.]